MNRYWLGMCIALVACGIETEEDPIEAIYGTVEAPLTGYCSISVAGGGSVDLESEYLPHVVSCENGAAPMEALKAQAVAARAYVYHSMNENGFILDSQDGQVYSCGNPPQPQHYEAVSATAGEVVSYQGVQVAAFYVSGKIPSSSSCVALDTDPGSYNEKYITYNWGKTGNDVEQSTIGFIAPTFYANRGCKSQNGASCLANQGWGYKDILRFYYGADIEFSTPPTSCAPPPQCTEECVSDMEMQFADCSVSNCGAFGSYCSMALGNGPACVFSMCVDSPNDVPVPKEICVNGQAFFCDEEGQIIEISPPAEVCDGVDNNCNGLVDEGVTNACGSCGPVGSEVCDGFDNDCDGQVDEGVLNECGTCGSVPEETCDGFDNDCDGQVDEGVTNVCGTCGPVPLEICDEIDNDCDGQVDEAVLNACGACGPVPEEVCANGVDDDCDGVVDEDCVAGGGMGANNGSNASGDEASDSDFPAIQIAAPSSENTEQNTVPSSGFTLASYSDNATTSRDSGCRTGAESRFSPLWFFLLMWMGYWKRRRGVVAP